MSFIIHQNSVDINNLLKLKMTFNKDQLNIVQQVYAVNNRYITSAYQINDSIIATVYVDSILGIERKLNYVPASTISAIISQCCSLTLWSFLQAEYPNPLHCFNLLVENELIGFRKENHIYYKRLPLKTEVPTLIDILQIKKYHGDLIVKLKIELDKYMRCEILCYVFISRI